MQSTLWRTTLGHKRRPLIRYLDFHVAIVTVKGLEVACIRDQLLIDNRYTLTCTKIIIFPYFHWNYELNHETHSDLFIYLFIYFQNQCLDSDALQSTSTQSLEKKVLDHVGLVVNIRILRTKFNANTRPTKEETGHAMHQLQKQGFGVYIQSENTAAFLKQIPPAVDEGRLQCYMSLVCYKDVLCRKNFDLPKKQLDDLLLKDPLGENIKEYLQEQQENISDH